MLTHSLFENFIGDSLFRNNAFGIIRVHPDNEIIRGKFKSNDLVVITHQARQTLGKLKFDTGVTNFSKYSICFSSEQRRDLALAGIEDEVIALEIRKGNWYHVIIYFVDSIIQ